MKKLFIAALAVLAMSACNGKSDANEAAENAATEVETTEATEAEGVVVLDNDSIYRPDTKVDVLTILDFNATWCGPCKMLSPVFDAAAKKFTDVKFVSIDIDNLSETAQAFRVESIPTVVFLKPDGTSQSFVGTADLLPAEKFEALVTEALK
jgi:thioredoxin 1